MEAGPWRAKIVFNLSGGRAGRCCSHHASSCVWMCRTSRFSTRSSAGCCRTTHRNTCLWCVCCKIAGFACAPLWPRMLIIRPLRAYLYICSRWHNICQYSWKRQRRRCHGSCNATRQARRMPQHHKISRYLARRLVHDSISQPRSWRRRDVLGRLQPPAAHEEEEGAETRTIMLIMFRRSHIPQLVCEIKFRPRSWRSRRCRCCGGCSRARRTRRRRPQQKGCIGSSDSTAGV